MMHIRKFQESSALLPPSAPPRPRPCSGVYHIASEGRHEPTIHQNCIIQSKHAQCWLPEKIRKKEKTLCGTLCGTRGTFVETLYMINCKDFSLGRFSKIFKLKLTYWRKWTSSRRKCACCWVVSYFSCDKYDLFCQKQSQVWWFK